MHDEEQRQLEEHQRLDARKQLILRLVERIIAHKNTQFILDHQNDSLEQLSAYLKACMEDIGHPPSRVEIIGGDYIEYRFGGEWYRALRTFYDGKASANLKNPPTFENRKIVRDLCAELEAQEGRR